MPAKYPGLRALLRPCMEGVAARSPVKAKASSISAFTQRSRVPSPSTLWS